MGSEMSRFAGTVTGVAMLVLLFVFPLYITSQNYGNILRAKYKFFWLLVLIMTGVCLIAGLAWVFMDRMEHHGEEMREFSAGIRQTGLKTVYHGRKGTSGIYHHRPDLHADLRICVRIFLGQ